MDVDFCLLGLYNIRAQGGLISKDAAFSVTKIKFSTDHGVGVKSCRFGVFQASEVGMVIPLMFVLRQSVQLMV